MPSKRVVQLCSSSETITSSLAHEYASGRTNVGAGDLKKKLWKDVEDADGPDEESFLENIARCGKWNERPGELFLKVRFSGIMRSIHLMKRIDILGRIGYIRQ
jgi:hypothetical protein